MPAIDFKALFAEERERRRREQRAKAEHGDDSREANVFAGKTTIDPTPPTPTPTPTPPPSFPTCALAERRRMRLADFEIGAALGVRGLHYVPDFITEEEERAVLAGIYAPGAEPRWVRCGRRRVQNWGGRPGDAAVTEGLPPFAAALYDAIMAAGICDADTAPNHVLVNEYDRPAGIAPHNDGALYAPHVAIVTLSGSALMDFWNVEGAAVEDDSPPAPDAPEPRAQVMLRPRSLLLYTGEAYGLRHGIRNASEDVVTERCANAGNLGATGSGGVQVGDRVKRGARRQSVVFVRKGLNHG